MINSLKNSITDITEIVFASVDDVSKKLSGLVYTEIDCPVYVINRSEDANDYVLMFDFENVIKSMNNNKLPKPLITVWSGRNDHDLKLLSKNIKDAFVMQFRDAKSEARRKSKSSENKLTNKRDSELSFSIAAFVAMLFLANPIVDLLLLGFALSSGKDAAMAQLELFKKTFNDVTKGNSDNNVFTESQEKDLIDAIQNLGIKIQKDLFLHAHSFGNGVKSLKGVDYKHQLPSFIKTRRKWII